MEIRINGYICEIFCGRIPRPCKDVFIDHIRNTGSHRVAPEWIRRRNPRYVSPEVIKQFWYGNDDAMARIMDRCGFSWRGYKAVNDLHCLVGFGTGKEGIGIFDMSVRIGDAPLLEYVPFDPGEDSAGRFRSLASVGTRMTRPIAPPRRERNLIAVSGGSWAKGTMVFAGRTDTRGELRELEFLVADATPLGIGEDHLVAGLYLQGRRLRGQVVRKTEEEMYPVSWFSPEQEKWLDLYAD